MGYFKTILFFMLFGTLISPDLKAQHESWHQSGYRELSQSEAAQYSLCQPDNFNHWYRVARGEDLNRVISGIKASLEDLSSAEYSFSESSSASSSGSGSGSSSGSGSASSSDALTPVSPGMPEPVTTDNRLLLILPAFEEPYTISERITLRNEVLGLCTQPEEMENRDAIPWEEQAVISLTDDNFVPASRGYGYAIQVNNRAELHLNNVTIDASEWSITRGPQRLIGALKYQSKVFVHHSTLLRKKIPPQSMRFGWPSLITAICFDSICNKSPPYLEVTDSRLYQGMTQFLSDIIQVFGGEAVIRDTQLVLSQRASTALRQNGGKLDITGGSVSTCSPSAGQNPMDCFKDEAIYPPFEGIYFQYYPGVVAVHTYYRGGQLNVQQVTFRGYWNTMLWLESYTLKINGMENTGNRLENIHLYHSLCGRSEPMPPGGIEMIGYGTCPSGAALAPSQIPADNGDYPDLTPPSWLTDFLATRTPTSAPVTHTSEFSDPPHNSNGAGSIAMANSLYLFMASLASLYGTRGL